ncbi:hypothetical protein SAMN05216327_105416 [Dyadobacter sp. SG02]|nr:hypothetical protein SAMN05216327_105416 [Dyadobacter sp. SG02]
MKKHNKKNDEQPARRDERQVVLTSLILFIISTIIRHFGPGGA